MIRSELDRLKLLSYNIQAGIRTSRYREYVTRSWRQVLPYSQRIANLDRIARLSGDFDIVALQEADAGSLRSGFLDQTRYLAQAAEFRFCYHQSNRKVGNIAHAGNGLLARWQPTRVHEHRLPGAIPGRGALSVRFGEGDRQLMIMVVHLALGARAREQQLAYIRRRVASHRELIVMGDFNASLSSSALKAFIDASGLREPQEVLHTFPAWDPRRGIDHILVGGDIEVERFEVVDVDYSDHRPLAMHIHLPRAITVDSEREPVIEAALP